MNIRTIIDIVFNTTIYWIEKYIIITFLLGITLNSGYHDYDKTITRQFFVEAQRSNRRNM